LYDAGRQAALEFLDRWDFAAYNAAFRSGVDRSRSETVADILGATRAPGADPTR
jgi:hypothetical protein